MQLAIHIQNHIVDAIKDATLHGAQFPITEETRSGIKHTIAKEGISVGNMITTLDVDGETYLIYLMK